MIYDKYLRLSYITYIHIANNILKFSTTQFPVFFYLKNAGGLYT